MNNIIGIPLKKEPNQYFSKKVFQDYRNEFEKALLRQWPNLTDRTLSIVDVGCGSGSALRFLNRLEFLSVDYVGIDISEKLMQIALKQPRPANWNMQFVTCSSANLDIFRNDSLDLVISASSLHHLDLTCVLKWTSKSLEKNGLLVLNEPSARNPFAKIGHKLIKGFHT
jgi:SAM-dependent methyltransferase